MTAVYEPPRRCGLHEAFGRSEACPGDRCPLWEPGGAVVPGRCAVGDLDLGGRADLASWLLELREQLEQVRTDAEQRRTWQELHRLLNRDEDE